MLDRLRALLVLACLGGLPAAAHAVPEDLQGWEGARWGMTGAELDRAFGERLTRLPGRWVYGGAYAERAILNHGLGDLDFTVYFQMNDDSERLQQVLLERRQQDALPVSFQKLQEALELRYGAAGEACLLSERDPTGLELIWRFPSTTLHATFLNFFSTSVLYFDPSLDFEPLRAQREERVIGRRTLPRRITLRYHPSDREDLLSPRSTCFPSLQALQDSLTEGSETEGTQ